MILCALGLIGEYLGRTYISISQAPQFVIRELVPAKGPAENAAAEVRGGLE